MSYSPSTMSDDNKPPPDPRYHEWDAKSRKELQDRLYEAVDKRREATEELIPRVISEQLHILGVNSITSEQCKVYNVSDDNVINKTHEAIDQQINDWKGLRWWRFNEKNACDSWNKWFKKAKCWQDQNQHKPLGRFWCLIFDELRQYTSNVAKSKYPSDERHKQALQNCLFAKCVEAILKGAVRFERTRETPLLPVRALTQSKELQQKLHQIDNGFVLSTWKQQAEADHKRQKQQYRNNRHNNNNPNDKGQRANVATILNERCGKHATCVYRRTVQSLKQIIPTLNIDMAAIESATQLNHNPYSTNSDYQTVSSINHNNNNNDNNNNRSRYQYIANDHINDERQRRRRTTTTTPAVFASLPSNMDVNANRNNIRGYGATRGMSDNLARAESHRYSPTLSSNCLSDTSSISDAGSSLSVGNSDNGNINNHSNLNNIKNNGRPGYLGLNNNNNNNNHRRNILPTKPPAPRTRTIDGNDDGTRSQLDRLSMENQELRSQLALIRRQLEAKTSTSSLEQQSTLNAIVQQMQMQNQMNQFMMAQNMKFLTPPHIPSPMTVGIPPHIPTHPSMHQSIPPQLPPSIPFNDRRGGHGIYNPPNGTMFYFPSKSSIDGSINDNNNKNDNNNNNNNINTVDMDQVINNNTMNMDIAMSSSSLSDDSSVINDNHKKKKHCNNNDKNNNINNNKNKNNPTTVQPGIYYNSQQPPHCFCSPPSDIIYHHQQEGCPPPETDNRSSPILPSFSSCTQTSGISAVSAPSTVYDIDDNDTQFPFNPYNNSTIDGSVPPPPPNYNKYPFDRENFDNFSVYGPSCL